MDKETIRNLPGMSGYLAGDTPFADLPLTTQDALYEAFQDEMPYGVQKARTGDPYQWLDYKLQRMFGL